MNLHLPFLGGGNLPCGGEILALLTSSLALALLLALVLVLV
jgi:hypothetical protein